MTEWIWMNGETMPLAQARVGVEDRGFQFADGVYEVVRLYDGEPSALREHLARLERSAVGIRLNLPMTIDVLRAEIEAYIHRIGAGEGMIYLQMTRGQSARLHAFPELVGKAVEPTVLFYFRPLPVLKGIGEEPGVRLISVEDERWQRCWVKSIALLPNVLAKSAAVEAGADEAVFVDQGVVTECAASNIFAVIDGVLRTHAVGRKVLGGVVREMVVRCSTEINVPVSETPFTIVDGKSASEVFITSTTREISPVSHWDDTEMSQGNDAPVTRALHNALRAEIAAEFARAGLGMRA